MYGFPTVRNAQQTRLDAVTRALASDADRATWVDAMVTLIEKQQWFRWHDSGDVFSLEYLEMIVDVVKRTPNTRHWLPTRELLTVRRYQRAHGEFPANLTVRLSLPKVDATVEDAGKVAQSFGLPTSTVSTVAPTCPARSQGNECRECRACWDSTVVNVAYAKH